MPAIIHIDGDAFFASCEIAQNERLRGRPVVTGEDKGIALAVSYEAKARGISRGMLIGDIRKICPEVTVLPSHYDLYKICSRRMCAIVRRHAPVVEEYSVDECFADVSSVSNNWPMLTRLAHKIKNDLWHDLGMTFSLGLAPTKTLAKVASKWKKPAGFTAIEKKDIKTFLKDIPISTVWGIGRSTQEKLRGLGIATALEFAEKDFSWIEEHFGKPYQEIWHELNGTSVHEVGEGSQEKHQSIRATRTFRPPSRNTHFLLSELSKNAERACARLRAHRLQTKAVSFFLKTQTFMYHGSEIKFDVPVTTPSEIMNAIKTKIPSVLRSRTDYRATGVVLHSITPESIHQSDLFSLGKSNDSKSYIYKKLDTLEKKYGRAGVFLASSLQSHLNHPPDKKPKLDQDPHTLSTRLGIPYWGEAI